MSKAYIKQLEDANEQLKKSLERESMLKEIESNRHKRWYRVEMHYLNHTNANVSIKSGEVWKIPSQWPADALDTYDVPGIEAARAIILSRLFMREMGDGGSIVAGVSWAIQHHRWLITGERPSFVTLKGWIVICPHYPAWGGNYIKHVNPKQDTVGVTESYFHNYSDYALWVQEKENQKSTTTL